MARNAKNTRMCSGCMKRRDKSELVYVSKTPTGIEIGLNKQTSHGRSAYLCPDKNCMEKSIKRKWFSRSLRCDIPPDFYEILREYFNTLNME